MKSDETSQSTESTEKTRAETDHSHSRRGFLRKGVATGLAGLTVGTVATGSASARTYTWPIERRTDALGLNNLSIQQLLTAHGYTLTIDANYGPETEATVAEFQADHGLLVDGIVGPQTWQALVITVSRGDRGMAVRAAQEQLFRPQAPYKADGIFGFETYRATASQQKGFGITVDGIVGPQTWRALTDTNSS